MAAFVLLPELGLKCDFRPRGSVLGLRGPVMHCIAGTSLGFFWDCPRDRRLADTYQERSSEAAEERELREPGQEKFHHRQRCEVVKERSRSRQKLHHHFPDRAT